MTRRLGGKTRKRKVSIAAFVMVVQILVAVLLALSSSIDATKEVQLRPHRTNIDQDSQTIPQAPFPGIKDNFEAEIDHDESVEFPWPWHHKNKTHSNSCSSHLDCYECSTSSSFCHWCKKDQKCHEVGSPYGCLRGVDCISNKTTPSDQDKHCRAHKSCGECATSSMMCHWCAHDNACHTVGSPYGCLKGVDCYSNDRCMREKPELIRSFFLQEMGWKAFFAIVAIAGCCFGCSSVCFCVSGRTKRLYEDMWEVDARDGDRQTLLLSSSRRRFESHTNSSLPEYENLLEAEEDSDADQNNDGGDHPRESLGNSPEPNAAVATGDDMPAAGADEEPSSQAEEEPITDFALMTDFQDSSTYHHRNTTITRRGRSVDVLHEACRVMYYISIVFILGFLLLSIRYFPRKPVYNVCNSPFAWKSIVDSITAFKVEAHFEILASVSNPNHFAVAVIMGQGTFSHEDVFIGSFTIPEVTVPPASLIDVLVVATFTPETWEALKLTEEYARGTLVLSIDSHMIASVPMLANFSFPVSVHDYEVALNDPRLSDRHLCACPTWKDEKNKTNPPRVFPLDMQGFGELAAHP